MASSSASALTAQQIQELEAPTATVISDLNSNNFSGAWSTALSTSPLFGTNYNSATTDPLLAALESGNGIQTLDPSKQWNSAEINQFYNALGTNPVYNGKTVAGIGGGAESLGKNPYGLWGSGSALTGGSDAATNERTAGDSTDPDVERFAGARPTQSFLSKYGADIAAVVATIATAGVAAPALLAAVPALGAVGAGAIAGAGVIGGTDIAANALAGHATTLGSIGKDLAGGAITGAVPSAAGALSSATGLSPTVAGGLVGAGAGAARGGLTGGNVGLDAAIGGITGAVNGSGVKGQASSALQSAGVPGVVASTGVGIGASYGANALGNAIAGGSNASGVNNGQGNGMAISPLMSSGSGVTNFNGGYSVNPNANSSGLDFSSTGSTIGSLLGAAGSTAAGVYGAQNAAEAQTAGINAGINTQNTTLGNISNLMSGQQALGNQAFSALGSTLGINGQPANYSNFENMPGYQFSVQQGTQAINRAAAAGGDLYTPNTQAAVGQYVTGTASQDYNNYVSQLMQAAGFGQSANQTLTGANLTTGGNVSQLQQNSGNAQASGVAGSAGAISSLLGRYGTSLGGAAGGAVGNALSGVTTSGYDTAANNYDTQAADTIGNSNNLPTPTFNYDSSVPAMSNPLPTDSTGNIDWLGVGDD